MQPNFALTMSGSWVELLHNDSTGWKLIDALDVSAQGFDVEFAELRGKLCACYSDPLCCKIIIPNDLIFYTALTDVGPDDDKETLVQETLNEATPYELDELAYDWSEAGHSVFVAAVARKTLKEAEEFALRYDLKPMGFVAVPETGRFIGEPVLGLAEWAIQTYGPDVQLQRAEMPVRVVVPDVVPAPANVPETPAIAENAESDFLTQRLTKAAPVDSDIGDGDANTAIQPDHETSSGALIAAKHKPNTVSKPKIIPIFVKALKSPRLPAISSMATILAVVAIGGWAVLTGAPTLLERVTVDTESSLHGIGSSPRDEQQTIDHHPLTKEQSFVETPPEKMNFPVDAMFADPQEQPLLSENESPSAEQAETGIIADMQMVQSDNHSELTDNSVNIISQITNDTLPAIRPKLRSAGREKITETAVDAAEPTKEPETTFQAYDGPRPYLRPKAVEKGTDDNPEKADAIEQPVFAKVRPRIRSEQIQEIATSVVQTGSKEEADPVQAALESVLQSENGAQKVVTQPEKAATPQVATAQKVYRLVVKPRTRPRRVERVARQAKANTQSGASGSVVVATQETGSSSPSKVKVRRSELMRAGAPTPTHVAKRATESNAMKFRKVNLIGVSGTPRNRRAVILLSNGKYYTVRVGDSLNGGKVSSITDNELSYVRKGQNIVLKMPRD